MDFGTDYVDDHDMDSQQVVISAVSSIIQQALIDSFVLTT